MLEKKSLINFTHIQSHLCGFTFCHLLPILCLLLLVFPLLVGCDFSKSATSQPRYVVTSPEIAEIVALLGAGDRIVGVSSECDYPDYLQELPEVGTFGQIDFEKVLALDPSLVFTSGLEQNKLAAELKKIGLPTVSIYSQSIAEMYESILEIGKIVEKSQRANAVVDSLQAAVQKIETDKLTSPKNIYVEIYGDPIMTVSDSSYVGNLIELIGANNIFDTLPRDYSRVSAEKVVAAHPEIIILTYPGVNASDIADRRGWQALPAVQNKRIYNIDDIDPDLILRSTPRVILGLKKLLEICDE